MNRVLWSLAAATALALPACGSGTQPQSTEVENGPSRLGDRVVARVDGTAIFISDVDRAAAAQGLVADGTPLDPAGETFRATLDELVDQRLLALDAVRQGLDSDAEAQRRLKAARERILGNYAVERRLDAAVTDETIRALYEDQAALAARGPERRIRQIVVPDADAAQAVVDRLADEEDFADIAQELSTDAATRDRGGRMGWVSRDMLPGAMRDPVFDTAVGERALPFATQQGWHIVEVLEARTPRPREFEAVREEIARFLTFQTIEAMLSELREGADIELTPDTDMADAAPTTPPDETDP